MFRLETDLTVFMPDSSVFAHEHSVPAQKNKHKNIETILHNILLELLVFLIVFRIL